MATSTDYSATSAQQPFTWGSDGSILKSSFKVSFPKSTDFELLLVGAELHQDPEEHDRLVLHFKGTPLNKKQPIVGGDPVVFTYSTGKLTSTWHGYIHSIPQTNTWQGGNTDVVCVGASYVLKDTDQKIYTNSTADQVVAKIAKANGMEPITQRHPRVKASFVQAGQSYWQVLKRLAKTTGFALFCVNNTIFFMSKDKIYQNKKASAPYFEYISSEVTGLVTRELRMTGTILNFKPIISDQTPEMGVIVDRVISGSDPKNVKLIKTTHPYKGVAPSNPGVVIPSAEYFLKQGVNPNV